MKLKFTKLLSVLLALTLVAAMLPAGLITVRADEPTDNTIYISTADELLEFAENCALDSWSVGKTAVLTADISLSGIDFEPIPTFSGIFDGGGHTISGLELSKGSTPTGFFSRVREGALVRDLRIVGTISASGSGSGVGGVVGSNAGTLISCGFSGVISGKYSVGGVVGDNLLSGELYDCSAVGSVEGESMTGGIVGNNAGTLVNCENHAGVNTAGTDRKLSLSDISIELDLSKLNESSLLGSMNVASDTGGVAGYSSGMVMSCRNYGVVGYQHIGYNSGGIAGRSSGFVSGCENHGSVYGRKDIGGIVGQSEPYVTLDLSEDNISKLKRQLDELSELADSTINDVGDSSDRMVDRLSGMNGYLNSAGGTLKKLGTQVSDSADAAVGEVNRLSNVAADVVTRINSLSGTVDELALDVTEGLDKLSAATDELAETSAIGSDALRELSEASDSAASALESGRSHADKIVDGADELRSSLQIKDSEKIRRSLDKIEDGFDELSAITGDLEAAVNSLLRTLRNCGWTEGAVSAVSDLGAEIEDIGASMSAVSRELKKLSDALITDPEKLNSAAEEITAAFDSFAQASRELDSAIASAHSGMTKLSNGIKALSVGIEIGDKAAVDAAFEQIKESLEELKTALDGIRSGAERALSALRGISYLDTEGIITAFEEMRDSAALASEAVRKLIGQLKVISENTSISLPNPERGRLLIASGFSDLKTATASLSASIKDFSSGMKRLRAGLSDLRDGIAVNDASAVRKSLENINSYLGDVAEDIRAIGRTVQELATVMDRMFMWGDDVAAELSNITAVISSAAGSVDRIADGVKGIRNSVSFDDAAYNSGLDDIRDGARGLISDAKKLEESIKHIGGAMNTLGSAGDKLTSTLGTVSDSIGSFTSASEHLSKLAKEAGSIFDYLAGVDPIQLPQSGGELKTTANQLFSQLSGVSKQVDLLCSDLSDMTGTLRDDILEINDKFGEIRQTVSDIFAGGQDYSLRDIFTDTTEENIDSMTSGKIDSCANGGRVEGDINVGGVVGAMAVEYELDPEDDAHDSSMLNRVYESRSAVSGCTNSGDVTSKKNCAGGICGRMELGVIQNSSNYGTIKSESGSEVGGIAGIASSKICGCYVLSSLSGAGYVGGIIGSGKDNSTLGSGSEVSDCVSIVEITGADEFYGAIAGCEGGTFKNNVYVSDTLRGVDRMSIDGGAQPIEYSSLMMNDDVPSDFETFTLRFVADGEELKRLEFNYGDSFDQDVYPKIPEKEGYYAVWSLTELNELHFNTTVEAIYIRNVTAIASEQTRGGQPLILVEGSFDLSDRLTAESLPIDRGRFDNMADSYPEAVLASFGNIGKGRLPAAYVGRDIVEQWKLVIPNDGSERHTVRLSAPTDTKAAIYIKNSDGIFEKAESTTAGKYFVFEVSGREPEFAVVTESAVWIVWIAAAAIILAALIVIFIVIRSIRSKKRVPPEPKRESEPYIIRSSDPETERREREIAELRILLEKERAERESLKKQVEDLKTSKSDKNDSEN